MISCHDRFYVPEEESIRDTCVFFVGSGLYQNMALTVADKDKYHPRRSGIHDVYAYKWFGATSQNRAQQWYYAKDDIIASRLHKDTKEVLFVGSNGNLITLRNLHRPR